MNLKTVVPLGAAMVLGLVAAIVARQLVSQHQTIEVDGSVSNVELKEIVVASRDIPPGQTLSADDLTTARVEAKSAPANVAGNPSALFNRVAKIQIPKGQIIHELLLAEAGVSGGLPGVIRPGYRAMTIEVNEFTGVAGLLQPGNRIDVLARFVDGDNGQTTHTVVQNIEIIAVGSDLSNKGPAAVATNDHSAVLPEQAPKKSIERAITVLVTPADAERLDLATANQARLVLRASLDSDRAEVSGATMAALRGEEGPSPVRTASFTPADDVFGTSKPPTFNPRRDRRTITIIRAGIVSETEVEPTEVTATRGQAGGGDMLPPVD